MNSIRENSGKLRNIGECTKYFWSYAWKHSRIYFLYIVLTIIVEACGPFVSIIATKYIVNEIAYESNRNLNNIVFWVAFICIGNLIYKVGDKFLNERSANAGDKLNRLLATDLSKLALKMKYTDMENPQIQNQINLASRALFQTAAVTGITGGFVSMASNMILFLEVVALVISSSPLMMIPIIISFIVSTLTTLKGNAIDEYYFPEKSEMNRRRDYFAGELSDKKYAQDIRIYDAGNLILDEQVRQGMKIVDLDKKQMRRKTKLVFGDRIATNICQSAMYLILGMDVLLERITIGEFSSLIQSALVFSGALNAIAAGYGQIEYTCSLMVHYMEFARSVKKYEGKDEEGYSLFDDRKDVTIEFRNVSFKYPNTDLYVLKNINAVIHNKEHVSIVGENGAGKTTFIKLLCRLYDVTEGEILINGRNIQSIAVGDYRKLLSVVFQDFKLLAFTIRDNITLGEENVSDESLSQMCEIGGISDWLNRTDQKLDTYLYKSFHESGVEPSGGEAQKIAIIRALYKNAPIVILDEPTAALDPVSEYEIYRHFDGLVGGKTAIYISHRLSSCKFCDRIIVFKQGEIVEDGTHKELVNKKDGVYATMYHTQAKHYLQKQTEA